MYSLADSTAKLFQGWKGRYVDREGVPMGKMLTCISLCESGSACMPNSVCVVMLWCFEQVNLMQG